MTAQPRLAPLAQSAAADHDDRWHCEVLSIDSALADPSLVAQWSRLVGEEAAPLAVYASPEWIAIEAEHGNQEHRVCVVRDVAGQPVCIAPVARRSLKLPFDIANRALYTHRLQVCELLGSVPSGSADPAIRQALLETLLGAWPDCAGVYCNAVPIESDWSATLHALDDAREEAREGAFLFSPYGQRPWHMLKLEETHEAYFKTLRTRQRTTVRRHIKNMNKIASPELVICETPEAVKGFLELAAEVSRHTWQQRLLDLQVKDDPATLQHFQHLAQAGLLRCYGLTLAGEPIAFVLGHQGCGTFQYAQPGFDNRKSELSPGVVLLHLVIEDLHNRNPPECMNFGIGDAQYKRRFANLSSVDESLLVLRRTAGNRMLARSHGAFLEALERVKRVIGREVR